MTPDKAIKWLQAEQFNQWLLFRGEDEKVSAYDGDESIEESINRFSEIIELQSPGKYNLKAYKGKNRQGAAMSFRFEVKPEIAAPIGRSHSSGSGFNPQEMYERAEQSAYNKFLLDQWRKDVDKQFETLFKEVENIKKTIEELHDDDDENDEDAMDRISNVAEKLPGLARGIESMKGMFSK